MSPSYPFPNGWGQGKQQRSGKQWASCIASAYIAASTAFSVSAMHQSSIPAKFTPNRMLIDRVTGESGEAKSTGENRRLKKKEHSYEEVKRKIKSDEPHDFEVFEHFIADHSAYTCYQDSHFTPFNTQVRGVNIGGWMVLEPWITPSMFYQFLRAAEHEAGLDMYTFCEVLGPEEGNKQLRRHWESWVTEEDIRVLAQEMSVDSVRLPVGDWQYKPYGPYIGCTDGANDYVKQLMDWAEKYDVTVLIDIHAMKGSQNGFDNSGQAQGLEWTSVVNTWPMGLTTFLHWPIRSAGWLGVFDRINLTVPVINHDNIQHSLDVIQEIVNLYSSHPAVLGLQPINEPWEFSPIDTLKKFYWDAYLVVKRGAPKWKYIIHDSFRFDVKIWGGFLAGCPERAIDTHIYQAWERPSSRIWFYENACSQKQAIAEMEAAFGPVIVGEWSLATDNCVMWLNGFNDNLSGFPMLPCKFVPCAKPYMGDEQPGTPVDPGKPLQGPFGSGISGPSFGYCPVDRDWMVERSGDNREGTDWMQAPPKANPNQDATDEVMTNLARRKLDAFAGIGHGYYFWNFKTELSEGQWDYMRAVRRKWIPGKGSLLAERIQNACHREDNGGYTCVTKPGVNEDFLRIAIKGCLKQDDKNQSYIDNLNGDELIQEGDTVFNSFWKRHKIKGATCDFGGTASLVLTNETDVDDEFMDMDEWSDDMVFAPAGYSNKTIIIILLAGLFGGGLLGFLIAMKTNQGFNVKVRKSLFPDHANDKIFTGRHSLFGGENMPLIPEEGGKQML